MLSKPKKPVGLYLWNIAGLNPAERDLLVGNTVGFSYRADPTVALEFGIPMSGKIKFKLNGCEQSPVLRGEYNLRGVNEELGISMHMLYYPPKPQSRIHLKKV